MNRALYFFLGAACGVAGTYFFLKNKYEQYAQEEIDSVKKAYKDKKEDEQPSEKEEKEEPIKIKNEKPPITEYVKKISDGGYKDYSTKVERPVDPVHKPFNEEPYAISPDEYENEEPDFEKTPLTYYADDVLAYELDDELFEDAEEKLIPNFEEHFGDYDENAVYIRNEVEKTDYVIYRDERTYEEVSGNKPHRKETEE